MHYQGWLVNDVFECEPKIQQWLKPHKLYKSQIIEKKNLIRFLAEI